jgi:hypothetical protein
MVFYKIHPEVPASIGKNSVIERIQDVPLKIIKLHLVFEGWLGGDLMETSPAFYVTKKLKDALSNSMLSGIANFLLVEVSKSENFLELYPNKQLPDFFFLKIKGTPYMDDFGIDKGFLIISERAKDFLSNFNLSDSVIEIISM